MLVTALPVEGVSLQKSLRGAKNQGLKGCRATSKSSKRIGSSARTRTWNPSVNSCPSVFCDGLRHSAIVQYSCAFRQG
jgi:hypothetical protein